MKSITIHKLPSDLAEVIERRSAEMGISQNKFIKRVLRSALGLESDSKRQRREYFAKILGTLSEVEAAALERSLEDVSRVDLSQW